MRGPVYVPGGRGYDAARVVFNRRWDGVKPPAVVRVRDAADVRAVVRWADRYDVPLVTRSGGHGYNGNSTSASAVVVDVGGLDFIRYADGVATVGPGARLGRVYAALARRGVTVPAGSCPTVAIGGLALGGGMGLAGRSMGLTLDRVRSIDVVTADGRRRRVSGDDDLFWALRGGGGSFGIVTAIRLRTRRVDRAAFFQISYGRGAREEALAAWDAFAPRAPRELTAIFSLTSGGATAFGQYLGSESALRRLIAPLGGSPSTGSADYLTVQRRWAGSGSGRVDVRGLLDLRRGAAQRARPERVPGRGGHRRGPDPRRLRRRDQRARTRRPPRSRTATPASASRSSPTRRSRWRSHACAAPGR